MKCGETIFVRDIDGSYRVRFIAQCGGRFLAVTHCGTVTGTCLNGMILIDWKAVLRELVALAVPNSMIDKLQHVHTTAGGGYVDLALGYPLQASQLAQVLGGADVDEVLDMLHDLAVPGVVVSHDAR